MRTSRQEEVLRAFGAALRTARTRAAVTQEELAERAGLHRTYVGAVERGERNVSLLNIISLAEGLACRPADLLSDLDDARGAAESAASHR